MGVKCKAAQIELHNITYINACIYITHVYKSWKYWEYQQANDILILFGNAAIFITIKLFNTLRYVLGPLI